MLKNCLTGSVYYLRYTTHLSQSVFASSALCIQMIEALKYYSYADTTRFSRSMYVRDTFFRERRSNVLAFCILPNEYHILIEQCADDGIYDTVKRTHESLTRYYNSMFKTSGRVFDAKTARLEYIYPELKDYTIKQIEELPNFAFHTNWKSYPWSSYQQRKKSLLSSSIQIDLAVTSFSFPSRHAKG